MIEILKKITPDEALRILNVLSDKYPDIQEKIINEAREILDDVDVEDIADDVFFTLDLLDVQDLLESSGSNDDGYMSPEEMAEEMVESELEPFSQRMMEYFDLQMFEQATHYCQGVMLGLYKFAHESKTEFKEWAADIPEGKFDDFLRLWNKQTEDKKAVVAMHDFLLEHCGKWAKKTIKKSTRK
jgi:hypothetical protein